MPEIMFDEVDQLLLGLQDSDKAPAEVEDLKLISRHQWEQRNQQQCDHKPIHNGSLKDGRPNDIRQPNFWKKRHFIDFTGDVPYRRPYASRVCSDSTDTLRLQDIANFSRTISPLAGVSQRSALRLLVPRPTTTVVSAETRSASHEHHDWSQHQTSRFNDPIFGHSLPPLSTANHGPSIQGELHCHFPLTDQANTLQQSCPSVPGCPSSGTTTATNQLL